MTYYVIETTYVGPNQHSTNDAQNILDGDYVDIDLVPGKTNMSHEERTNGWLGATNDVSRTAHGEYETLDEARAKVAEIIGRPLGECRTEPVETRGWYGLEQDITAERYYTSPYASLWDAGDWIGSDGITSATTNAEIAKIVEDAEAKAEKEGIFLLGDADEWLREHRDQLRADENAA